MSGLFGTLGIGRSGLNTSQSTISVSSHNISNSNTIGYSRQRAKIVTSRSISTVGTAGQMGTGSQVESINRIRNTFLDYQVRAESATLGSADVRSQTLAQIEDIFGEPSETGISSMLGNFFNSWQELAKQPNSSNARTIVAQQTLALTQSLNTAYEKLETLETNAQNALKQNVIDINSYLDELTELNKQIIRIQTTGQSPNDLMDTRDNLLDELSYKFGITIENKPNGGIVVKPSEAGRMKDINLVSPSGVGDARFSYISSIEEDPSQPNVHIIKYYKLGNSSTENNLKTVKETNLTESQLKDLNASRVIWGDSEGQLTLQSGQTVRDGATIKASQLMTFVPAQGEVGGNISVQKDINEFKDQLNSIARALALAVNTIHSGMSSGIDMGSDIELDRVPFFVNSNVAKYDNNGNIINLEEVLNSEGAITAKNITINAEILSDVMKIKTKTHDCDFEYTSENDVDSEGNGERASAIASLRDLLFRIQDFGTTINTREEFFGAKGGSSLTNYAMTISTDTSGMTFDSYFQDLIDKLGVQASTANTIVKNQETIVNNLEINRDSVSGVSLDEEMANLIQYQHAYSASAKVINTVDQLLDVVINGLMN